MFLLCTMQPIINFCTFEEQTSFRISIFKTSKQREEPFFLSTTNKKPIKRKTTRPRIEVLKSIELKHTTYIIIFTFFQFLL